MPIQQLTGADESINVLGNNDVIQDFGGTDTYQISPALSGDVTLTDQGPSIFILPEGMTVSAARFTSNGAQFDINGHTLELQGDVANSLFLFGGNPFFPSAGTPLDFAATAAAFGASIPLSGVSEGTISGDIVVDGSVADDGTGGSVSTFSLSGGASVDEGGTATFTLTTTNVPAGTDVDYTITGVSASDVVGGLTGTVTVGAGSSASISIPIVADQLTEGSETLTLSLDNGQASVSTVVLDTSVASANSYLSGVGGNGVTSDFNIEIVFEGAFSAGERAAFEMAADYLSVLITGDLPDQGGIDDIRITALLEPIDGPFNTLAFAGPTEFRFDGTSLPTEGEMTFDTADAALQLADGTLATTVAHEMLHALGFGTLWDFLGLEVLGADARFTGENAIAAYNAEFPGLAVGDPLSGFGVPIENDGGHWDESVFTTEVMTPFLDGASDYMSALTVASLEDLGYDTIFDIGITAATMPQLDTFMLI